MTNTSYTCNAKRIDFNLLNPPGLKNIIEYLPSSCFIFISSCSLMYLNCRAKNTKKKQIQFEFIVFPSVLRFGFGPVSLKPLSKNFFLSLNDRSDSVIDKSD